MNIPPPVTGTALGSDVSFVYKTDKQTGEGTLVLGWEGGEDHIHDKEVIGVIYEPRGKRKNEVQPQLILRVVTSQSAPETTKMRFSFEALPVTMLPENYLSAHLISDPPDHLFVPPNPDGSPNLHIIVSTKSGVGEAQQYFNDVLQEALATLDLDVGAYTVHVTESEKTITEIAERIILPRANNGTPQTIVLLSGDGGIVDTVNVLLFSSQSSSYTKPTFGLISMGTGNALSNSTGLNSGATRGLKYLFRGLPKPLPTFISTFSPGSAILTDEGRSSQPVPVAESGSNTLYGAVVCSWALHASLVADSDTTEYRRFGAQRFQMAAKELMAPDDGTPPHVYSGKITLFKTDDQGREYSEVVDQTKTSYIVATLVSNFEEKLTISPYSKPLDGQLRVLRFGDISGAQVMRLVGMALRGGGHVNEPLSEYSAVSGMRIEMDEADSRWRRVCVDGKIVKVEEGGWFEVRKGTRDVLNLVA